MPDGAGLQGLHEFGPQCLRHFGRGWVDGTAIGSRYVYCRVLEEALEELLREGRGRHVCHKHCDECASFVPAGSRRTVPDVSCTWSLLSISTPATPRLAAPLAHAIATPASHGSQRELLPRHSATIENAHFRA